LKVKRIQPYTKTTINRSLYATLLYYRFKSSTFGNDNVFVQWWVWFEAWRGPPHHFGTGIMPVVSVRPLTLERGSTT
jgi:hypothetical protein